MLAYFDCFSGISGDMTLGALVHLGVPLDWLEGSIASLPLEGFALRAADVEVNGIRAKRVVVEAADSRRHRHYTDIRDLVAASPLPDGVKASALAVFRRLAEAEAAVHGCAPEEVHFHEVGAVDAIVDIVGAALGLHRLGVTAAAAAPVPTGSGFVDCRHGRLPVPAPATAWLLKGIPTHGGGVEAELTTPTGAAILATFARDFGPQPPMIVRAVGYGAGSRELSPGPNLLRLMIGEALPAAGPQAEHLLRDRVAVAEANIDDMNPELFGHVMERLFAEGALDAVLIPVQMKKGRPGVLLQALCPPDKLDALARLILSETTSLGVRYHGAERLLLAREAESVQTSLGQVRVKRVRSPHGALRRVPEYEECRRIALASGLPIRDVYERIAREANSEPSR
jgi:uncharacterized protein (TIGR00299 family) protein